MKNIGFLAAYSISENIIVTECFYNKAVSNMAVPR
jgi:hypothetical protein